MDQVAIASSNQKHRTHLADPSDQRRSLCGLESDNWNTAFTPCDCKRCLKSAAKQATKPADDPVAATSVVEA